MCVILSSQCFLWMVTCLDGWIISLSCLIGTTAHKCLLNQGAKSISTCAEPNDRFWGHEWECHGTCTKLGQAEFFRTVLSLNQKYNLEASPDLLGCVSQRFASFLQQTNGRELLHMFSSII